LIYHLGILHFLPTFILAGYYFLHQGDWLGFLGFCLIMFAGVGIDSDHYLDDSRRLKEILAELKKGKLTIGEPNPAKINFFHTIIGLLCMSAIGLLIMHVELLLGSLFLSAYLFHCIIIDPLDCDNQNMPTNPLPVAIHNFFWKRSKFFRRVCFKKKVLSQIK